MTVRKLLRPCATHRQLAKSTQLLLLLLLALQKFLVRKVDNQSEGAGVKTRFVKQGKRAGASVDILP